MQHLLRDFIPYALNLAISQCRQVLDTWLTHISLKWWKVQIGNGLKCFGRPIIRRHPTARIIVGDHCVFRSAEWSSSIGLNRRCFIEAGENSQVVIGRNCGFSGTVIAASGAIFIGDRVLCGGNCTIVDNDRHPIGSFARANNVQPEIFPVLIEDDVFLGMNVVVLKGSLIGKGTVVAANSVVTNTLPPNVLAGGVPAKVIKNLD